MTNELIAEARKFLATPNLGKDMARELNKALAYMWELADIAEAAEARVKELEAEAPEPEWEERTAYGSQLESGYITIELRGLNYSTHQRTVRRGPWLPLKGESE